jgi:hypothetical protein
MACSGTALLLPFICPFPKSAYNMPCFTRFAFITYRLGAMWSSMSEGEKNVYFTMAKKIDAEHKNKYPGK